MAEEVVSWCIGVVVLLWGCCWDDSPVSGVEMYYSILIVGDVVVIVGWYKFCDALEAEDNKPREWLEWEDRVRVVGDWLADGSFEDNKVALLWVQGPAWLVVEDGDQVEAAHNLALVSQQEVLRVDQQVLGVDFWTEEGVEQCTCGLS